MARIEWVALRLNNWALYKSKESSGGLGWKTQCAYLNVVVDGGHRDSPLPIDETDAAVTDLAVESLKASRAHLYDTLHCCYITHPSYTSSGPRTRQAQVLGCAVSTVDARLGEADRALRDWFAARQERQQVQAALQNSLQNSFEN